MGAQPTEAVEQILKITGDWQKFKGLPGTEGTLKVKDPKRDKLEIFNEALKDAAKRAPRRGSDPPGRQEGRPGRGRSGRGDPGCGGSRCRGSCRRGGSGRRGSAEAPAAEAPAEDAPAPVPADETPEGAADAAETAETETVRQGRVLSGMLAEALEHLVRGVVDNPDDVTVRDKQLRRGSILEVRVHPDDLGKVIGRNGRTATAFRTVIGALAGRAGARIDFVDVDRGR